MMRQKGATFYVKLALTLIFMAPALVGASFLTPHIENHGTYKQVAVPHEQELVRLLGHVPPDVVHATHIGPVNEAMMLDISIVLALNHEAELDDYLLGLTNQQHRQTEPFLTSEDFLNRYSPTIAQVDTTTSYLRAHGFRVVSIAPNRLVIKAKAPVKIINTVFNTEIHYYTDNEGARFFAPAYELQVDDSLPIQSVLGLENRIKAKSHHKVLKSPQGSDPTYWQSGPLYGLTPTNIKTAYSIGSSFTGTGQTLALFELDGFNLSDITAYEDAFGLPHVPLQVVLVDGVTGTPGANAGEVVLDIELMIAMAPNVSKIIVYEGPNTAQGLLDTYNKIATDNLAKSVSTSWGVSETSISGALVQAENTIFKQMAAQGQSLYAASGDNGAYDNGVSLSVDDPSSQPLVAGVGGTRLSLDANGNYVSETTYSYAAGPGEGGGGGISSFWSIPTWQQGLANSSNFASSTMRNVPDISIDADPETGYAVYFNGQWQIFGGTSCGAPLWAAFTALANQSRQAASKAVLGFPNPALYQIATSLNYATNFHDIADNSNNGFYPAVSGFDLATGWGSPVGDALIASLTSYNIPPTCVRANPTVTITPSSQQSLAGRTLSYTVSLTNNDNSACGNSLFDLLSITPVGFTKSFQQSTLTVTPGQVGSTTLSVTSASNSSAGSYSFSASGTNRAATSFSGSGSATYIVQAPLPDLHLTISPLSPSFSQRETARFTITLTNGTAGIVGNPITIAVTGPISWTTTAVTGLNGQYIYSFKLSKSYPVGQYNLQVTSSYQGVTINTQTPFSVHN